RIVKAAMPAEEVRLLFSEILSSLKEGCRLRDLAVICGDPERYHDDILSCASALQLPVFFDATQPMDGNPLFLLVSEALEVLSEDYSYESISALMKTPLFVRFMEQELDPSDTRYTAYERICEFENFCFARGVRSRARLEKPFTGRYRGFAEGRITAVNEVRSRAFTPVFALQEGLKKRGASLGERIGALRDFLDTLKAEAMMQALAAKAEDLALRSEYERSWEILTDFLKKTEDILADEMLSFEAFREVLISGLSALRIGLVPPSRDELIVGDLMRTRLSDIRRLYVIGANEGVLPMQQESGGLLSDRDRELLQDAEIPLSPTAREEGFRAQFYLYRLLSLPSESVWISFASSDTDGKARTPSYVIGRLQQLFPTLQVEEKTLRGAKEAVWFGDAVAAAAELLQKTVGSEKLENLTGEDISLLSWLLRQEESKEQLSSVLEAVYFRYDPEKLRPETAEKLFGSSVYESVTRLEAFANCPFAHFLQYGLQLQERPEYRVETADMGSLLHNSINTFFRLLSEENISFSEVTEQQCTDFAEKAVSEVAELYGSGLLKDSARNRYLEVRVRRLIDRTVAVLKKQWEAGDYESTKTEVPFGGGSGIDAVRLPIEEGLSLSLTGRIDRMDIGRRDGRVYVKIIDYKSGKKDIDFTKVYYGLQLQLLLYMEAARAYAEKRNPGSIIVPAGIYYYHVDDPMVDADNEEDAEKKIASDLRLKGITNVSEGAVSMIDREISGYSNIVLGLQMKKDGSISENNRTVTQEEMAALSAFAVNKAKELGS
ncbi:MAG: PD-(D/E)XK nuclease family protein, partial [Lachnospiraceae bacterium]|nr:PD-(D/E)XK nuclease family protein [Lachnospiraceae bacterium]